MDWIGTFKDWWWLILTVLGLIATLWRYSIKLHKAAEALNMAAKHDKDIKDLRADIEELKGGVGNVHEALAHHIVKQDGDMSAIMTLLLEISEAVKNDPEKGKAIQNAHKDFQKHLVKRKEN